MANTLRFKRGLASGIPTALAGEPLFTTDTFDLYIGNGTTNTRFQKYIASGATTQILRGDGSLYTFPLAISSPTNGQVLKYNGTSWVNDSDSGITGSGSAGQVAYFTGATTQAGSNNLFWDNTNARLGIGTTTPTVSLDVAGNIAVSQGSQIYNRTTVAGRIPFRLFTAASAAYQGGFELQRDGVVVVRLSSDTPSIGASFISNTNFLLGSTTDSGQRLQVSGDTLLKGSGNTSGTTALTVQNSDGTALFSVRNDNVINIGLRPATQIYPVASGAVQNITGRGIAMSFIASSDAYDALTLTHGNLTTTANGYIVLNTIGTFNPTSGTATYTANRIGSTINQTGGANGITRGLYVNPTLTAAADWRSIEWSNNTGWGLYGVGTSLNYLNGNLLLGSTTNSGQRLQVTGDTLLKGSGNTSATVGLTIQNSDATNMWRFRNDGSVRLGELSTAALIFPFATTYNTPDLINGRNIQFFSAITSQSAFLGAFYFAGSNYAQISGAQIFTNVTNGFAPTSGTASFVLLNVGGTINQTGGANGVTRGLYVNPTLTAAADWRSIEWSNNTGWGLYGAGTAQNFLAGNLGIGTTTLSNSALRVNKAITGAVTQSSIANSSTINSDVTSNAWMYVSSPSTQAAAFTIGEIVHFNAFNLTIGAGSAVTNHIGFRANSSLTSGTNVWGFYGDIPSGTGRWNLYMNGSANNYMAGSLGIGTTTPSRKQEIFTATSGSTVSLLKLKNQGSLDSGAAIDFDFFATDGIGARISGLRTSGISFQSALVFYTNVGSTNTSISEAARITYLQNFLIGSTTDSGEKLQVTGTMKVTGATVLATASGANVGIGVTPSTWSLGKSIEINNEGQGITSLQLGDTLIMNGVYYNSSLKYANSTYAISLYRQFRGVHSWYYAAQGTAGNTVTFNVPMTLETTGNLLLGSTTDDTVNRLQVTGSAKFTSSVTSTQFNLSALNTAPATSSSTGTLGEIRIDADYIYICTATNTWKRVAIATF